MIPKVIHYCWFGGNPKSELIEKCISSWNKYCPDYEIIEWNEWNFDIHINSYVQEAYEEKKWAFVSDYARIWALNKYGGIYFDTDVEVIKSFDQFLQHDAFTGFETKELPFTAVFGCKKGHPITKEILEKYSNRKFKISENKYDMQTNTEFISKLFIQEYGAIPNNTVQKLRTGLVIYPSDFFSPKNHADNKLHITENTHAIHWFDGSWIDYETKKNLKIMQRLNHMFGKKYGEILYGVCYCMQKEGIYNYIKNRVKKYAGK